jgi:hypothetical protein
MKSRVTFVSLVLCSFLVPGLAFGQGDTPVVQADPCNYQKTLQEARQLPPCPNDAGCAAHTKEVADRLAATGKCEMQRLTPPVYYLQPEAQEGLLSNDN